VVTGPAGIDSAPSVLSLSEATPNPGRGIVTLFLQLPKPAPVSVTVHDVQGRDVWSTTAREYAAGRWPLRWDATGMSPGVYLMRVRIGDLDRVRRVAVVR
jgi:hypothetical protein